MNIRQLTDRESKNLTSINNASNGSALLFLTAVGLAKGILDATEPVRKYLAEFGFHSFEDQATGPGSKVTKHCRIVLDDSVVQTTISLYRPATKKGDPRFWIYSLSKHAAADDVLSLVVKGGILFVFNLSKLQPVSNMAAENSFLDCIANDTDSVASEAGGQSQEIAKPKSNDALNASAVSLNAPHDMEGEDASQVNEVAELYPAGLLNWAGHRSGGVRKPFLPNSGRPTGDRLETPLLTRMRVWIDDLVSGVRDTPRSLLLVGGPGNGKTDAIESCIELFDRRLGASGAIFNKFARQFREAEGLPPRRVLVDLRTLGIDLPENLKTSIALVQDATEGDPNEDATAEELLLSELATRLDANESTIYLCCVNRGILAQAATVAHRHPRGQDVDSLVTQITRAVTSGPDQLRCWPLDGYDHVAVWPMDVESLVDANAQETTVAHQIFRVALDERRWTSDCKAGSRCPFCWNRRTLSQRDTLNALIKQLRFYELASGKRWTFRDLFSLVPYLLVGDASELRIKDKGYQPCEWAAKQLEFSKDNSQVSSDRAYAPYLLVSRLFHHRLFGRWPALDSGAHRRAKEILGGDAVKPGLQATRDLFHYLSRRAKLRSTAGSDIGEILEHPVSDCLDPALASGTEEIFYKSGSEAYSCSDIEELFSLSVSEGLEVTKNQLAPLERDLLASLVIADEVLVDENFAKNDSHHVRLLQGSVRQFAARITKRSLGVRQGLCLHFSVFKKYDAITEGKHDLNSIRRQMTRLLHGDDNSFSASLVTTFGQPVASRNREIRLITRRVSVREIRREDSSGRPRDSLPYLQVAETIVPMTFPLFKALEEVDSGLHQASLPAEIFTLLNGVKSLVSGRLVRDELMLQDDARIVFGAVNEQVEILDGEFRVSGRDIS